MYAHVQLSTWDKTEENKNVLISKVLNQTLSHWASLYIVKSHVIEADNSAT